MKKLLNSFKKYFVIWIAVICWGIVSITNFGPRLSTFLALFPFIHNSFFQLLQYNKKRDIKSGISCSNHKIQCFI